MAYEQLMLDNQLCFRLYTASRLVTSAYTPFFKDFGITYPQYLVLLLLWEKDGRLVGDITERLHLETNTVTPLLQRMEKQQLVKRCASAGDGRQRLIVLTDKGRQLQEQLKSVPGCLASSLLASGMTPDDRHSSGMTLDDRHSSGMTPDDRHSSGMTLDDLSSLIPLLDKLIGVLLR